MQESKKYGFFTAISMVVGIVIGSGIFFKADDVLLATGGSVALGVLGFLIVGFGVLFGTLVISQYAIVNSSEGGIVAYAKDAFGNRVAYFVSWFLIAVYFPCLIMILGYVTAMYLGQVIGIYGNEAFNLIGALIVIAFAFLINIFSKRLGGLIQGVTVVIKLIPLAIIAIAGILFFQDTTSSTQIASDVLQNKSFLAALISIAFTFDGWIVVTSISKDLKNPTKILPRALSIGMLVVTVVYCLYFIGVTNIITPADILVLGDDYTTKVASILFGPFGAKLILIFVVVSVYGGVNGMVLAYLRLPHALVSKGMMKNILNIGQENEKIGFSNGGILFAIIMVGVYFIFQLLLSLGILFPGKGFDLSTMPIIFNYIIYSALYIMVFRVTKKKNISLIIYVVLAIATSLLVIYGALQSNGLAYILICLTVTLLGFGFYKDNKDVSGEVVK